MAMLAVKGRGGGGAGIRHLCALIRSRCSGGRILRDLCPICASGGGCMGAGAGCGDGDGRGEGR